MEESIITYKNKTKHRTLKNVAMCTSIVALGVAAGFTVCYTANNNAPSQPNMSQNGGTPPEMNSAGQAPSGNPPAKPDQNNNSNSDNSSASTPPDQDSDSNDSSNNTSSQNNGQQGTPPEMPNGENGQQGQMGTPPNQTNQTTQSSTPVLTYILFAAEATIASLLVMYLIMSKFNKKSAKETLSSSDKTLIYILSSIILAIALFATCLVISNNISQNSNNAMPASTNQQSNAESKGATTVNGEEKTLTGSFSSSTSDENAILTTNKGTLTLNDSTVEKTGDASNTENADFYGLNAAILTQANSTSTIKNTTITTNGKGANAVFANGTNAKINISDSVIKTTGQSSSRGLDATGGGSITGKNLTITTQGGSCATLATDRGEGTVKVSKSKLETNGAGSPLIYSTGDISLTGSTGTANKAQITVVEGKNSATIKDSTLGATGTGNRNNVDHAGVMIYQSMSGDASEGTGTFTAKDSDLSILKSSAQYKSVPFFFVTNTDAVINLENTKLNYGSNTLLSAKGTSEWGNSGSNGGNVTLNTTKQNLTGDIVLDKLSALTFNLSDNSTYTGTINGDNKAKKITLKLDNSSKIKLTGDSYVTSFSGDTGNIDFNGHKLYVNGKAIN